MESCYRKGSFKSREIMRHCGFRFPQLLNKNENIIITSFDAAGYVSLMIREVSHF